MVSVLLAAYNGGVLLEELIASLQRQTLRDFRVLWQDDGSTDGTASLLERVSARDERFQPGKVQGSHLGAKGNFLSLMAQDDAPYTALCDQDDVWAPQKLQTCLGVMKVLEGRYGPDTPLLVHSDCRVTDESGTVLHNSFIRHQGWDSRASRLNCLLVQNNVTGCTLMMNAALRRLVAAHAKADKLFMHDWFIALTAAAFGHIGFIAEPLVDYRQHGGNVMGASRESLFRRATRALRNPQAARERIRLTYRHAHMFRDAYCDLLPPQSRRTVQDYLDTQALRKVRRVIAVRRGGYVMQSRIARAGQMLFG